MSEVQVISNLSEFKKAVRLRLSDFNETLPVAYAAPKCDLFRLGVRETILRQWLSSIFGLLGTVPFPNQPCGLRRIFF